MRFLFAWVAAGLVLGGLILGTFADGAWPGEFLLRPLAVAALIAAVIGAAAVPFGRSATALAAVAALVAGLTTWWTVLLPLIALPFLLLRRWRQGTTLDLHGPALVLAGVFFAAGLARALPLVSIPSTQAVVPAEGPPTYVVLLDGYARADTLQSLGIDNTPFIEALEARGFDYYPEAHSLHSWTQKTLLAMLTDEQVPDGSGSVAEKRRIRARLRVPAGFLAIDPGIGHVTLTGGPHVNPGGVTDFETNLLALSAAGMLAPDWTWDLIASSLRNHLEASLAMIATTDARRVFAHLISPHPPFILGPGTHSRRCWPQCHAFHGTTEHLDMTIEEWARQMRLQIEGLNPMLLDTIDRILAEHPDAVIVLFSDHGGRYTTAEPEEWHRSFLAARTPGYPNLFDVEPRPDTILRTLSRTYWPAGEEP